MATTGNSFATKREKSRLRTLPLLTWCRQKRNASMFLRLGGKRLFQNRDKAGPKL